MPRVTQYIREDDFEAWNAIENKSEWIHQHLKNELRIIKTPEEAKQATKPIVESKEFKTCKNGHAIPSGRSKCTGKGCKYS